MLYERLLNMKLNEYIEKVIIEHQQALPDCHILEFDIGIETISNWPRPGEWIEVNDKSANRVKFKVDLSKKS